MDVIKFILRFVLFAVLSFLLITSIAYWNSIKASNMHLKNNEIESNILHIKDNDSFDLLIMGISHARMFSRNENHQLVEDVLHYKIKNIGMGGNLSDVALQKFYLEYLLQRKNHFENLMIVMSPPMMMNESLSLSTNSFFEEPFRYDFLYQYTLYPEGRENRMRSFYYIKSKFDKYWLEFPHPFPDYNSKELASVDSAKVNEGMKDAYRGENPLKVLGTNQLIVEEIIQLCVEYHITVTLIITPTVFGKWQYHEKVDCFCKKMASSYNVRYYDFSDKMNDIKYFYDHHHFNSSGVRTFATQYLAPIFP